MAFCPPVVSRLPAGLAGLLWDGLPVVIGIRDQRLVGVHGDVLHGDLLLASTPMLIKPLS